MSNKNENKNLHLKKKIQKDIITILTVISSLCELLKLSSLYSYVGLKTLFNVNDLLNWKLPYHLSQTVLWVIKYLSLLLSKLGKLKYTAFLKETWEDSKIFVLLAAPNRVYKFHTKRLNWFPWKPDGIVQMKNDLWLGQSGNDCPCFMYLTWLFFWYCGIVILVVSTFRFIYFMQLILCYTFIF